MAIGFNPGNYFSSGQNDLFNLRGTNRMNQKNQGDANNLYDRALEGNKQFDTGSFLNNPNQNRQANDWSDTSYSHQEMLESADENVSPTINRDIPSLDTVHPITNENLSEDLGETDLTLEDELLSKEAGYGKASEKKPEFKNLFQGLLGGIGKGFSEAGKGLLSGDAGQYKNIFSNE